MDSDRSTRHAGARAVAGVHSAARLGLSGLAFHPVGQGFDPASRPAFAIYETASEHGMICLFHTGFSRLGSGMPGGTGLRLSHGDPRAVDEVAATFPDLQIVIAHLGRLWRDEAVAVASHKSNVWLNLVGTDGQSFLDDIDGVDVDRCLFGSDWCFASLDAALDGWKSRTRGRRDAPTHPPRQRCATARHHVPDRREPRSCENHTAAAIRIAIPAMRDARMR